MVMCECTVDEVISVSNCGLVMVFVEARNAQLIRAHMHDDVVSASHYVAADFENVSTCCASLPSVTSC
jgi:hypothetical protein